MSLIPALQLLGITVTCTTTPDFIRALGLELSGLHTSKQVLYRLTEALPLPCHLCFFIFLGHLPYVAHLCIVTGATHLLVPGDSGFWVFMDPHPQGTASQEPWTP